MLKLSPDTTLIIESAHDGSVPNRRLRDALKAALGERVKVVVLSPEARLVAAIDDPA